VQEVEGEANSALTVDQAVKTSCTTMVVKGLAQQLVDEINCARPGTFRSLVGVEGVELDDDTFPYVQTPLADALAKAAGAARTRIKINSALRTLPQQYLLFRWQRRRCGIPIAASPGKSNHESGTAVDVANNAAMRPHLTKAGLCGSSSKPGAPCFKWLGKRDRVHFDYVGGGDADIDGQSVLAFQRLWNRNNPKDLVPENGRFGAPTEQRLKKAPADGFREGPLCGRGAASGPRPDPEGAPAGVPANNPSPDSDYHGDDGDGASDDEP
jgi:hypothetical protein